MFHEVQRYFTLIRVIILLICFLFLCPSFLIAEDQEDRKEKLRYIIMDVHEAADAGNLEMLEKLMPPIFKYSFGGDDLRESAIKYYRENPEKLKTLASILEMGCKSQGEYYYSCPPQDADKTILYFGPRAGFEYDQKNKKWIFKYFVEGD